MQATVDEVGAGRRPPRASTRTSPRAAPSSLARTPRSCERARAEVAEARRWGFGEDDLRAARRRRGRATGWPQPACSAATYTPHCAAIHPARLVRGLARRRRARAASTIYEQHAGDRDRARASCAPTARHGRAPTSWSAPPRATPPQLPGLRRAVAPVYSLMIATEPLPDATSGTGSGCADRETFTDHRHLIIYGQRTADGRLAFGGRGAPYHFGSRIRPEYDREPRGVRRAARGCCVELLPGARAAPRSPTRGAARSASPATGAPRSGWTAAPGWPGPAATSATASPRPTSPAAPSPTWSLGADTDLVRLPWVGHRSPPLGARAAALARRQRLARGHDRGRRRGGAHRTAVPPGRVAQPGPGSLT